MSFQSFKNGINTEFDEFLTPINYSRSTYNFNFHNGALKTGLGIEPLMLHYSTYYPDRQKHPEVPEGLDVLGAWVYNFYNDYTTSYEHVLVIYCSDGNVYYNVLNSDMPVFYRISFLHLTSIPKVLNYKLNGIDSLIFTSKTDGMHVWSFYIDPYKVEDAPNINNMCLHYERLFATVDGSRSEVWFSDDLDPTNWSVSLNEAGFIQMVDERGPLNKVISLHDYVYVFREYGISRITAYAEQTEFNVTQMYLSSNRIYEKTVCACGDNIFFLANDGIYVFNGINASKLTLNIESLMQATDNAIATYHNGKYYLALKLNYNDNQKIGSENEDTSNILKNNTLLEIDVKSGEVTILRGVNVLSMLPANGALFSKLIVCVKRQGKIVMGELTNTGTIFGESTKKYWQSPPSELGYPQSEKIIKEMYFQNNEPFTLTIQSDKETRNFQIDKTHSVSKIKPGMKGRVFTFIFSSNYAVAHISNPQIVFGVL